MRSALLFLCLAGLGGCQPLALSMLGAGAGEAFRYTQTGVAYRTFTASAAEVKHASLEALERMGIAAKNGGWLYDTATASEIVAQTERVLASAARGGTVKSSSF